jgi:LSD1 subclass zinc finger protein
MEILKTSCEVCRSPLEFPRDFDNVICAACGAAYQVRQYKGAINLVAVKQDEESVSLQAGFGELEARLAGLDEIIEDLTAQVEVIRSKEQGAPLQMGCAVFGVFSLVLLVIAFFMTVARSYFGEWPFYLSLLVVVLFGAKRMHRKLTSRVEVEKLREERQQREIALADLEDERDRLQKLRQKIVSRGPDAVIEENGG